MLRLVCNRRYVHTPRFVFDFCNQTGEAEMEEFKISMDFADNFIFKAKPEYALLYLYAYRHKMYGKQKSIPEISEDLGLPMGVVKDAVGYWAELGFDIFTEKKIPPAPDKSRYSPREITSFAGEDKNLALLYEETEKILAKPLSTNDQQTLFWIYNDLGFEASAVLLLLNYAKSVGKCRIRYVEKIAMDWSEKGIVTYAEAEEYLNRLERSKSYEERVKRLFGIERNLTAGEKNVVKSWCDELKPSRESLLDAYEICIERIGKFSAKYINAILVNKKNGVSKNKAEIAPLAPKATRFNNFSQSSGIDYKQFELEALKRRMAKSRGDLK